MKWLYNIKDWEFSIYWLYVCLSPDDNISAVIFSWFLLYCWTDGSVI